MFLTVKRDIFYVISYSIMEKKKNKKSLLV